MSNSISREFARNGRGNVALMFALSMPIFLMAGGLALDYSRSADIRTELAAAADAAALSAVTPAMMNQSISAAQAAGQAAFNALASQIGGTNAMPVGTVTVTTDPNNPLERHVVVVYTAQTNNMFAGYVGMPTTTVGGQTHSSAQQAPNIDFYVLLDNSPSMALPQTQDGINEMIDLTSAQGGCALACHMAAQDPGGDTKGNLYWNPTTKVTGCTPNSTGCVQMDNYQMARNYNIPLRIDNLSAGMTALLGDADGFRASLTPVPNYSFTVNTMDSNTTIGFTNIMPKTVNTYSNAWSSASANLAVMEMWGNGLECATVGSNPCGASAGGDDIETNYDDSLSKQLAQMTTPGNGSNTAGDAPQGVLFIVTDGVEDESNGGRLIQAINQNGAHNYCNDIKAKGVKIAILYTTYLPLTTNSFYNSRVAPFQPQIAPQLQACATSGLFITAEVGEDLGTALGQLFEAINRGARLSPS